MKKIITLSILSVFLMASTIASAQKVTAASPLVGGTYGNTIDTVDNTESITKYIKVENSHRAMSIQVVVTKISGTVAGTVRLMGSNDGTNFVDISSPSIAISALRPAYTDTLTCTNVTTNTKIWDIPLNGVKGSNVPYFPQYLYYGLNYTGSGTMSAKFRGYLVPRGSEVDH